MAARRSTTHAGPEVQVCLIVPDGSWELGPLVTALERAHADWRIGAVWGGDPHRRPTPADVPPGVAWIDLDLTEPTGVGWNRLIVAQAPRVYEWTRCAAAAGRALDQGARSVVVLRAGSVAVLGECGSIVTDAPATLVARSLEALPSDGLAPGEAHLRRAGNASTCIATFTAGGRAALAWLGEQLVDGADDGVGPWLDRMGQLFGASPTVPSGVHVLGWHVPPVAAPSLLDLDALDRSEPWHVSFGDDPARVRLSADAVLAGAVAGGLDQIVGQERPLRLPGAIRVDEPIRALVARAVREWRRGDGELPPEPFGASQSAFVRWLEEPSPIWGANVGRYWRELRTQRADLLAAFPRSDSSDQDAYIEWVSVSWLAEDRSVLLRPSAGSPRVPVESVGWNPNGINVVGYLGFDSSLGDVARRIVDSLSAAHVPVAAIDHFRTGSPRSTDAPATDQTAHYATNLAVVNADQFHFFVADHAATLLAGRRTIGYWFWELDDVPAAMRDAIDHVDEIWAGSTFVADAFARVTSKPVRHVPIPVDEPRPSDRDRASFGVPDDRFVFLVTFDHFSVAERKNPFGAVEAFVRAFPEPAAGGPVLVVKTINGRKRWANHERLLLAAAGRADIVVLDAHLPRADQMAMLACADCLVSLHRSEGLGLHCAEAMWLAKPVIATRYSGNLDFMDDTCSALVDATMVPVTNGEGVYPTTATWADPDLDQAADWMRRLVADRALAARLGQAGRERMRRQASPAATGRTIAQLAGLGPYAADTRAAR